MLVVLQARVKAITEIVAELMRGVKEGRDINLNTVKFDVTSSPQLLSFLSFHLRSACVRRKAVLWVLTIVLAFRPPRSTV